LEKSTESDAITSFKYALGTFVKFLSKCKHKELFTAFVGYLEFYIQQRPRGIGYGELVHLVGLKFEYQKEQNCDSYHDLSRSISDVRISKSANPDE